MALRKMIAVIDIQIFQRRWHTIVTLDTTAVDLVESKTWLTPD